MLSHQFSGNTPASEGVRIETQERKEESAMRKYLQQGLSFACLLMMVLFGVVGSSRAAFIDSVTAADGTTNAKVGNTVIVQGSGLTPNTTLGRITIGGVSISSVNHALLAITGGLSADSVVTSGAGTYRVQFTLPAIQGGQQFLTVGGTQATTPLNVLPQITSVSPFNAKVGDTVQVTGNGFKAGSLTALVSLGVAGSSHADNLNREIAVGGDGTIVINIALKDIARAATLDGTLPITAIDRNITPNPSATASFRVIPKVSGIDKTSVTVGTVVTVTGAGFPAAPANVVVTTPGPSGGVVTTTTASALGVVSVAVAVPAGQYGTGPNTVTMQVAGEAQTFSDAGGITVNASAAFATGARQAGTSGDTTTIIVNALNRTASDNPADEEVNVTFDGVSPTAITYVSDADDTSTTNGVRKVTITIPNVPTSGPKNIVITGKVSGKSVTLGGFVYSNPGLGGSILADKSSGNVGDTITLTGFGFLPTTNVGSVTFGNVDRVVTPTAVLGTVTGTTVTTDAGGIFKVTFVVPSGTPQSTFGPKEIRLTGAASNAVLFSIQPKALTPAADARQIIRNSDSVAFTANGLAAGERVEVKVGTSSQVFDPGANANGEISGTHQVFSQTTGDKALTIRGLTSNTTVTVPNVVTVKSAISAFTVPVPAVVGSVITIRGEGFPANTAIKVNVKDYTGDVIGGNLQEGVVVGTSDSTGVLTGMLTVANHVKTRRIVEFQDSAGLGLLHAATTHVNGTPLAFTVEASSASPILSATNVATSANSGPVGATVEVSGTVGTSAIVNLGTILFGGSQMLKKVDDSNLRNNLTALVGLIDDQSRIITSASGTYTVRFTVPARAGGSVDVTVGGFSVPFTVTSQITELNDSTANVTDKVKGDTIKVEGNGFGANETVRIDFGSSVGVATTTTDAFGNLNAVTFALPAQAGSAAGIAVKATGLVSGQTATSTNTVVLNAKITLSFSTGGPGDQVKVSGVHFGANENIRASLAGGEVGIIGTTDATGSFTDALMALPAVPAGSYSETTLGTLANSGISVWGDISARRNTQAFTIIGNVINVNPGSAKVGDVVTITGAGFTANSPITVFFEGQSATTSVSGTSLITGASVSVLGQSVTSSDTTDSLGRLVARFAVPANVRGGTTGLRVRSVVTGSTVSEEDSASLLVLPSVTVATTGNLENGDTVTFTVGGFAPDAGLEVKLGGVVLSPASGAASTADTNGSRTTTYTIANVPAGGKALTVRDVKLDRTTSSADNIVTILPLLTEVKVGGSSKATFNSARAVTSGAVPFNVALGDTVTLTLTGMPVGASLAALQNPALTTFENSKGLTLSPATADANGNLTTSFVVPGQMQAGLLTIMFSRDGTLLDFAGQLNSIVMIVPSLSVSPVSGASGTTITVSGKGYKAGRLVQISYAGVVQRTAEVNSAGEFTAQITAGSTLPGSVAISATDTTDASVTASTNVFVFSPTGVSGTLTATTTGKGTLTDANNNGAGDVTVGSTVRLVGAGFSAGQVVGTINFGSTALTPAVVGVGSVSGTTVIADNAGAFEVTVVVPESPKNTYTVTLSNVTTARTFLEVVPLVTVDATTKSVKVGDRIRFSGVGFDKDNPVYEVFSSTRFTKWTIQNALGQNALRADNVQVTRLDGTKAADTLDVTDAGRGSRTSTNVTVAEGVLTTGYIQPNTNGSFDMLLRILDLPAGDYFIRVGGVPSSVPNDAAKFTVVPALIAIENLAVPGDGQPDANFDGIQEALSQRNSQQDVIRVKVNGFSANSALTVKLSDVAVSGTQFVVGEPLVGGLPDRTAAAAPSTDANGSKTLYFLVPTDLAGGVKDVKVVDAAAKEATGMKLDVLPSAVATGSAAVKVGEVRTFNLFNFANGEKIAIDIGNNPVFDQDVAANDGLKSGDHAAGANGQRTLDVKIPVKPAGARDIRFRGLTTGVATDRQTAPIVTVVVSGQITEPTGALGQKFISNKVTVKGNGFGAGEVVTVSLGNTALGFKNPQTTTAAADGSFSLDYVIQAQDRGTGTNATKTFRAVGSSTGVIADATATLTTEPSIASVSPTDAQRGSTVFVTGIGFPAGQALTFTLDGSTIPSGVGGLVSPANVTTDANGAFSASIRLDIATINPAITNGQKSLAGTAGGASATWGTLFLSDPTAATGSPTIVPTVLTAFPDDVVMIRGFNFPANTTVGAIQLSSMTTSGEQYTDVLLTGVTSGLGTQIGNQIVTNANGVFEASFRMPVAGQHAAETVSRTKNVRVGTATPVGITLKSKMTLSATKGGPGSTVTITARGLKAGTNYGNITFGKLTTVNVTIDAVTTGAREGSDPFTVKTDGNGVFVARIKVPSLPKDTGYNIATSGFSAFDGKDTFELIGARITGVSPASVEPGARIRIDGDGFAANQVVAASQVTVGGVAPTSVTDLNNLVPGSLTTDASGKFAFSLDVPPIPFGSQTVQVKVDDNQNATGTVTIVGGIRSVLANGVAGTVAVPSGTYTPPSATKGQTIVVSAVGFAANETVTTTVNGVAATTVAKSDGSVVASFGAPEGAFGTTNIEVRGVTSGQVLSSTTNRVLQYKMVPSEDAPAPAEGPVGTAFSIVGHGFPAGASATLAFAGATVGSGVVQPNGVVTINAVVPTATLGAKTLTISAGGESSSTSSFSVKPRITLNPNSGTPVTTFTISGTGFGASVPVTVSIVDPATTLGTVVSNGDGTFTMTSTMPVTVPNGARTIRAVGGASGNVEATFNVGGSLIATPTSANVGNLISVRGTGFKANTLVVITLGGIEVARTISDSTGGFSGIQFTVPAVPGPTAQLVVAEQNVTSPLSLSETITLGRSIAVTPTNVTPAQVATVTGSGYGASEALTLKYDGQVIVPTSGGSSDSRGQFTLTFVVPNRPFTTQKTVEVLGVSSGFSAPATVNLSGALVSIISSRSGANVGTPGDTIIVSGTANPSTNIGNLFFDGVAVSGLTAITGTVTTGDQIVTEINGNYSVSFVLGEHRGGTVQVSITDRLSVDNTVFTIVAGLKVVSIDGDTSATAVPKRGSVVSISGMGFANNEVVRVKVGSIGAEQVVETTPATILTSEKGSFAPVTFKIGDVPGGALNIKVEGLLSTGTIALTLPAAVTSPVASAKTDAKFGDEVTVKGTLLSADSALTVLVGTTPATVVSGGTTNAMGDFETVVKVPAVPAGLKAITVRDAKGLTVTVADALNIKPSITVAPDAGTLGATVAIKGYGFAAGQNMTIVFGTITNFAAPQADDTGSFSASGTVNVAQTIGARVTVTAKTDTEVLATNESFTYLNLAENLAVTPATPAKAGVVLKVGVAVPANATAKFSIAGVAGAQNVAMSDDAAPAKAAPTGYKALAGTYTVKEGDDVKDAEVTVTVTVGDAAPETFKPTTKVTIDTAIAIKSAAVSQTQVANGDTFTISVTTESGATVKADVSAVDSTQTTPVALTESATEAGTYTANVKVSADNKAETGAKTIAVSVTDAAANAATQNVSIRLQNETSFTLSLHAGVNLVHVPVKVATLKRASDLFALLGGTADVSVVILADANGKFQPFTAAVEVGSPSDLALSDGSGAIVVMRNAKSVTVKGGMLGENVALNKGVNLIGVTRSGAVATANAIKATSSAISLVIAEVGGEFRPVSASADVNVTGGQAFLVNATDAGSVSFAGGAWSNAASAAPVFDSAANTTTTPVFVIEGGLAREDSLDVVNGLEVSVTNLRTNATIQDVTGASVGNGRYATTFVNLVSNDGSFRIGDTLELRVNDPTGTFGGVRTERHTLTTEDIRRGRLTMETILLSVVPERTSLLQNYPNPFNPETWIPFELSESADVTITVYSPSGQIVRTLELGALPSGSYTSRAKAAYWDGTNDMGERVASGLYLYRIEAGSFSAMRRMVILK
jgi:hypothetical protein